MELRSNGAPPTPHRESEAAVMERGKTRLSSPLQVAALCSLTWCVCVALGANALAQNEESERIHKSNQPVARLPKKLPPFAVHELKPGAAGSARVYTGTIQGLFVSDDAGESWAPLSVRGTHEEVFSVAVDPGDPERVLAARRDGLWQSRDGGKTWLAMSRPVAEPYLPLAVALAESSPDMIYLATAGHGVFRSTDSGRTWSSAGRGLPPADSGDRPEEFHSLAVHPRDPDTAFLADERNGLYRTTDGGESWRPLARSSAVMAQRRLYPPRLAFDPDNPDRLLVVLSEAIHSHRIRNLLFEVLESGTWLPMEVHLPDNTVILGITTDRSRRVLTLWTEDGVLEIALTPAVEKAK